MSDRQPAPDPLASLIDELRAPVAVDPASKRRVMQLVREAPLPSASAPARLTPRRSRAVAAIRRMRGGAPRHVSASTLATAAGIALVMAVGTQDRVDPGSAPRRRAVVIGDSVASMAAAIRDTLRIVQFMLTAPAASRVSLAGDFNGWHSRHSHDSRIARRPMGRHARARARPTQLCLRGGRHPVGARPRRDAGRA